MKYFRLIFSSAVAAQAAIVFAVVVTIWGESSASFKAWLADFSGHHWTTKSIFTLIVYAVVMAYSYTVKNNPAPGKVATALNRLTLLGVAGSIILIGYFAWHFYG